MVEIILVAAMLSAALLYSAKDVLSKKPIDSFGATVASFYTMVFCCLPLAAYLLATGFPSFSANDFYLAAIVGAGLSIGNLLFYKGIDAGLVSLTGFIGSLWVVFTVIAAFFFFGETLSAMQMAGVALGFAGIFVMSWKGKVGKEGVLYAFLAAAVWGLTWFNVKPLVQSVGFVSALFLYTLFAAIVGLATVAVKKQKVLPEKSLVLPGVLLCAAYLADLWVVSVSTLSFASALFAPSYFLMLFVFTYTVLGERLEKIHFFGTALVLVSITLISIG
ncbi:MAG: DMT family transporter [Candidatus Norongarragalinales archaeon]